MRESEFIRQNQAKWTEFEALFNSPKPEPRRLTDLYVQITEDLAYAQTFYPNRSVRAYLNQLSQRIFQRVYRNRHQTWAGIRNFWTLELPRELWAARVDLLLSFMVFVGALCIGLLSSVQDPGFAELILGADYVSMTRENIEAGDPMKVYKDSRPFDMFLRILLNNLLVDVLTFVSGMLFAIGTLFVVLYNGIMVGSFQYFFVEYDLFRQSALTIWQHGTLEISAMVLAGAAGLTMGRGIAFPGTFTRMQAFRLSAVRGLRIMAPVVLMTLVAAFLESWITRQTALPDALRLLAILGWLTLVLGYLVWYPYRLARSGRLADTLPASLPARQSLPFSLSRLRSSGELFALAFSHYSGFYKAVLRGVLFGALGLGVLAALFIDRLPTHNLFLTEAFTTDSPFRFLFRAGYYLRLTAQFGAYHAAPWLAPINLLGFFLLTLLVLKLFGAYPGIPARMAASTQENAGRGTPRWLGILAPLAAAQLPLFLPGFWGPFAFGLCFPICMLWACSAWWERSLPWTSLLRAVQLIRVDLATLAGGFGSMVLLSVVGMALVNSPVSGFFLDILHANLPFQEQVLRRVPAFMLVFQTYAAAFLLLPLNLAVLVGYYFHALELSESQGLKARVEGFGQSRNRWT
ncbi:MAG: hypothetical protein GC205_08755 [Bacteroidetes bacterium]|nr:hypothetical protein [Bacteroidota bacterium]